jgi:hypothetical protein
MAKIDLDDLLGPIDLDALLGSLPSVAARQQKSAFGVWKGSSFNKDRLVVLRLGLGRDSMTMLVLLAAGKLVVDERGRRIGPKDIDAVVFTDPGHEWSFTYDLIPRVQAFCDRYGLRFLWQKKPPAEGPKGWVSWMHHQMRSREAESSFGVPPWRTNPPASIEARCVSGYYHQRIPLFDDYGSKDAWITKDDSSCTVVHKIVPNRELLVDLQMERFGMLPERQGTNRRLEMTRQGEAWGDAVRRGDRQSHLMFIGYAADELDRLSEVKEKKTKSIPWTLDFDTEAYPLMLMGIKKGDDEQAVLDREIGVDRNLRFVVGGFSDVKKSGCRSCKEQDAAQWWMLRELDPVWFRQMVDHERRVVVRTGPWQAIFPKSYAAVIFSVRRRRDESEGEFRDRAMDSAKVNPYVSEARRLGQEVTIARQVKVIDEETGKVSKKWERISKLNPASEFDEGDRAYAHVWIPIEQVVDRWLDSYRKAFHKDPVWEEVARKEYRGGCAAASLAE